MAKQKTLPIITHTEILTYAIRSLEAEAEKYAKMAEIVPEAKSLAEGLEAKLDAIKQMYFFETGTEYV